MADQDNNKNAQQGRSAASSDGNQEPVIVAIGASAGGVSALQSFFAALPEHTGAAFVVVVHLDPQHRSELPSILATRTRMPVIQVDRPRASCRPTTSMSFRPIAGCK